MTHPGYGRRILDRIARSRSSWQRFTPAAKLRSTKGAEWVLLNRTPQLDKETQPALAAA
jgi:hypothetical protein